MKLIGEFAGSSDIGSVGAEGSASFDAATASYRVTGSGYNMWFDRDAFRFVWTPVEDDVSLAATVEFPESGRDPHRKAGLVIRQDLDEDSVYASVAVHGDGLTSLQFRDEKGGTTHEIQSNQTGPTRVRIERRGAYITFSIANADGEFHPAGGNARIEFVAPFYVGLAVCSHITDHLETAVFSDVEIATLPSIEKPVLYSTLETIAIASTDRRVVKVVKGHIEAPNWTPDGADLIYNGGGRLYRIPASGGDPAEIPTGFATRCNNDHGISPDGKSLVISDQSQPPHQSIIYTLPIEGGEPKRITEHFPSYWHGWSPDGQSLTYCAQRGGKYGIFVIPVDGGQETRLTETDGLDDGPEYSPDGKYIYFNSDRTGLMQIWRMQPDGSNLEQITFDDAGNWFAHLSPDGRWMAFLTYDKAVKGHPADKDVMLRLMSLPDGKITILAKLFGGQGTINVPSWSPDSNRLAFVSYNWGPDT